MKVKLCWTNLRAVFDQINGWTDRIFEKIQLSLGHLFQLCWIQKSLSRSERKLPLSRTFPLCVNLGRFPPWVSDTEWTGCLLASVVASIQRYLRRKLASVCFYPSPPLLHGQHVPPQEQAWPHRMSFHRDACCFHLPSSIFHPALGNCRVRKQWTVSFLLL